MPLPRLLAEINKRVFNPREIKKDKWVVLTHTGRTSGETYQTPLAGYRVDNGYLFILMYGSGSDWVRNVFAAGGAKLADGSDTFELTNPRLVDEAEVWPRMPQDVKPPASFMNVNEYLEMDIVA